MRKFMHSDDGYLESVEWKPGCWVNVECPDADDIRYLLDDLGVPESFIDDTADMDERPRIEREGPWVLTIIRVPLQGGTMDEPYITVPIGIFTTAGTTVTICHRHTDMLDDFIQYSRRRHIDVDSQADFVLRLLYSSQHWYQTYLKLMNEELSRSEKELERSVRNEDLLQLMKLQWSLVFFNTSQRGNETIIGRFKKVFASDYDPDLLDDVQIELKQALGTATIYSDILNSTMDAFASVISNNVNMVMKRMTGVTIVLMVPTLIASFYGMNVGVPMAQLSWAFWAVVGLSMLLTAAAFVVLRRVRWF